MSPHPNLLPPKREKELNFLSLARERIKVRVILLTGRQPIGYSI